MKINKLPSQELLNECFSYSDGKIYWREDRPESHFNTESHYKRYLKLSAGKPVGTLLSSGYLTAAFTIKGKRHSYLVHRVIYKMLVGCCDDYLVDHKNGDRKDNRIENLRKLTSSQNLSNMKCKKKSGLMGAYYDKTNKRWKSQIKMNKVLHHLGWFNTEQDAHDAYMKARTELHKTF